MRGYVFYYRNLTFNKYLPLSEFVHLSMHASNGAAFSSDLLTTFESEISEMSLILLVWYYLKCLNRVTQLNN